VDYDTLRLFLHLSRTLRFARTSKECHISPSALSRAVQRLERAVGWPLFERDQRRVSLTPEGARFAAHARQTLEGWEELRRRLRSRSETLTGTISLFASVTACQSFLPRVLGLFRQRHPDVHIALETGYAADALDMAARGKVDVAVAAIPDRVPAGLLTRVLLYTPRVFVAPVVPCDVSRLVDRQPPALPSPGLQRGPGQRGDPVAGRARLRRRHRPPAGGRSQPPAPGGAPAVGRAGPGRVSGRPLHTPPQAGLAHRARLLGRDRRTTSSVGAARPMKPALFRNAP
jgi:DNA-binding transcriptional LysR family regulator